MISGWLTSNKYRSYPFREDRLLDGTVESSGVSVTLPRGAVTDIALVSCVDAADDTLSLVQVAVGAGAASATFTFQIGETPVSVVASAVIPTVLSVTTEQYAAYGVLQRRLTVTFSDLVGEFLAGLEEGDVVDFSGADLEWTVVQHLAARGLESLILVNRTRALDESEQETTEGEVSGDVVLSPGYNVALLQNSREGSIRVSARKGAGLGQPCEKLLPEEGTACGEAIFSINGQHPDWKGRMFISPGKLVTLHEGEEHSVVLRSTIRRGREGCRDPE